MTKLHFSLALVALMCVFSGQSWAQGCSDAGVCALPGLSAARPGEEDYKLHTRLEYSYGVADHGVIVHNVGLRAAVKLCERWLLEAYVPYVATSGELGSFSGLGDPIVSARVQVGMHQDWQFHLSGGVRMPANDANKTFWMPEANRDISAPMPYQTSLGTWDFMGGASATLPNKWLFALGAQYTHDWNNNSFLARLPVPEGHLARKYEDSNQLRRMPDLMFRAERQVGLQDDAYVLGVGLLGIVKVKEDQVYYPNTAEFDRANFTPVVGSTGLTLNAYLSARIRLAPKLYVSLLGAVPVVTRDKRPDGLTRSLVVQSALGIFF